MLSIWTVASDASFLTAFQVLANHQRDLKDNRMVKFTQVQTGQLLDLFQAVHQRIAVYEYTENAFVVHSLDKETLEETGIQNCDVAVVCISEQMDTSILTTLNLVALGIPKVIAKAASAEHGIILAKLGAEVVYPERDMAIRLASRLETARDLDIIQLSEKINITKMQAPDQIVGKTVAAANLRGRFGLNIIAIEHDGLVIDSIHPDYVFRKADSLFLVGRKDGLLKMDQWAVSHK